MNYLVDKFEQIIRNKDFSLEFIMKLELFQKYVQFNNIDCDIQITISSLMNKIGNFVIKEFDSLKDEMFDELGFKILQNEKAIDEY